MVTFDSVHSLLHDAVERQVIPSASYAVGRGNEVLWSETLGYRSLFPEALMAHEDTLYDMASLSKLLSTTMVTLRFLEEGRLLLSDPLSRFFTSDELSSCPMGRSEATIFHLLTHTSGISPHIALWRLIEKTSDNDPYFETNVVKTILSSSSFCRVGEQVHYSCMGFILLQVILQRISGKSLDALARELVFAPLGMEHTGYCPFGDNFSHPTHNAAATEFSPLHQYYICGHVHDENAHFLGGVSGNAGVFSTLHDMTRFARMLALGGLIPDSNGTRFLSSTTFQTAIRDYTLGLNESRGLGFQLRPPLPQLSAAGDLFPYGSFGHTGFTGTSLYVDGNSGIWAVLLTNAVHLGRDKTEFFRVRRLFHNAVMGALR